MNQSIEDASQSDHVELVNAIHKATGCNRPLSSDYFTGDINLTVFLEEMFKAQAARQSSQSEPVAYNHYFKYSDGEVEQVLSHQERVPVIQGLEYTGKTEKLGVIS
jgi:hypothetical protein